MNNTKVLYIDDERTNLIILKKMIGKSFDVLIAESGKEGLEILADNPDIQLVITDLSMPQMSGIEFIKEAQNRFANKKYFIYSGFDSSAEIQDLINDKLVCGYFQKPGNFKLIEKTLSEHA